MLKSVASDCHKRGQSVLHFVNATPRLAKTIAYTLPSADIAFLPKVSQPSLANTWQPFVTLYEFLPKNKRWTRIPSAWKQLGRCKKWSLSVAMARVRRQIPAGQQVRLGSQQSLVLVIDRRQNGFPWMTTFTVYDYSSFLFLAQQWSNVDSRPSQITLL